MDTHLQYHKIDKKALWLLFGLPPKALPEYEQAELLYSSNRARIWRHPDHPGWVSKLSFLKSTPRDVIRKYGFSEARRVLQANKNLENLGIRVPKVFGYGFTLNPFKRQESLIIMEEFPEYKELREILKQRQTDSKHRTMLLHRAALQMAIIYRSGFHHKDTHFGNILCLTDDTLMWIDNDLRYSKNESIAAHRLVQSIRQIYNGSYRFLQPGEWTLFSNTLADGLSYNRLGRQLVTQVDIQNLSIHKSK